MHYILGIILHDSDMEILEDESPEKGSYMGLLGAMSDGRSRMKQSPNIKQINIYSMKQGQRTLAHRLFPEA